MKKAIAMSELALLLLAAAAGIGLVYLGVSGVGKAKCAADIEICRDTIATFKTIKKSELPFMTIPPRIDCMAVSPPNCEDIDLKGKKKQETMFIIAENLRWCWHKTLGRENSMGRNFAMIFLEKDQVDFCLVCSEFTMPKDVGIEPEEWTNFLETKKIPRTEMTYDEFVNPLKNEIWGKRYKDIRFNPGQHYYVVSVSAEHTYSKIPERKYAPHIYIDKDVDCGTADPQIHYQRQ